MRINLEFVYYYPAGDEQKNFEDFVSQIKKWERSSAKNRRFRGVKVASADDDVKNGVHHINVIFDGEEWALRKLMDAYLGISKKTANKDKRFYDDAFEKAIVSETDFSRLSTKKKHFVPSSEKKTAYWIGASEYERGETNYYVKINWALKRPYLAPLNVIDPTSPKDLRPFLTTDPKKIHYVALQISDGIANNKYPNWHYSIHKEEYRETSVSRWNNTGRAFGLQIFYDPNTGNWTGGIDEKLGEETTPLSPEDMRQSEGETSSKKSKYEDADPRSLPFAKKRVERTLERDKRTLEAMKGANKPKEAGIKELERKIKAAEAELVEINTILGSVE